MKNELMNCNTNIMTNMISLTQIKNLISLIFCIHSKVNGQVGIAYEGLQVRRLPRLGH